MEKKGTGWIPDYPDINDSKLQRQAIQNLANGIYSQGDTATIEKLANKVCDALGILAQEKGCEDPNKKQLLQLQNDLVKEILGDTRFVTVKLHDVFKKGMADPEVLLIKNYLQRIISTWKEFNYFSYNPVVTNTEFDCKTHEAVIEVLKTQEKSLQADGLVSRDDMKALELLAHGADLTRNITPFWKLIEINEQNYKNCSKNKSDREYHEANLFYQGVLTSYLFPLVNNLYEIVNLIKDFDKKPREEVEKCCTSISPYINNLCIAYSKLQDSQHQDRLKNVLDNFKENLCKTGWLDDELRDLAFLSTLFQADASKKDVNNNDPLSILGKLIHQYDSLKEHDSRKDNSLDLNESLKEFNEKTNNLYRKLKILMGQLYLACIPEIPSQLFEKITISVTPPIPLPIVELFKNKLFNKALPKLDSWQLKSDDIIYYQQSYIRENCLSNQKFLQLFVEILVQILMPLGQYRNLNEVIDLVVAQVINKFAYVLDAPQDSSEKSQKLSQESRQEYNIPQPINYPILEKNGFDFQQLIIEALEDIKTNTQTRIEQEVLLLKEPRLSSIIKKFDEQGQRSNQKIEQLLCSIKKPLFEISNSQLECLIGISKNLSQQSEQSSQQMNSNSLVFPINSSLCKKIKEQLHKGNEKQVVEKSIFLSLPEFVDLTYWCTPVEDQGSLNSCTAHAGIALSEYAENKSSGTYVDGSSRFLYKVTRNLMQRKEDSGASVRDTMKAMVAFGVCPEQYWTYDEDKFDEEPTPFCYSFAENYKTLKYFRLDYGQISRHKLLAQVKVLLASEIPCIFGFTLYNSVYDEFNARRGHIPLPHEQDKVLGGHTVVAVGYHDRKVIENGYGEPTEGALLIRNSWGTTWGQGGYGWMPYDYIIKGLTADWWCLLKAEWLATGRFGAGASAWNGGTGGPYDGQDQRK